MDKICEEFLKNPSINPFTGRSIKIGGPKYVELVELCKTQPIPKAEPKAVAKPSDRYDRKIVSKMTALARQCDAEPIEFGKYYSSLPISEIESLVAKTMRRCKFGNLNIVMIGEDHLTPNPCSPGKNTLFIDGLVNSLVQSHPEKRFDLFVEIDFPKSAQGFRDVCSYSIALIWEAFSSCFAEPNPKDRKCAPNLRVHYVDFRSMMENSKKFTDSVYSVSKKMSKSELKHFAGEIRTFVRHPKIRKQFQNFEDKKLGLSLYTEYSKRIEQLIDVIVEDEDEDEDDEGAIFRVFGEIQDIYCMGRMLRNFGSYKAENVIFYGGAVHVASMARFLQFFCRKHSEYQSQFKLLENIFVKGASCIPIDVKTIFDL